MNIKKKKKYEYQKKYGLHQPKQFKILKKKKQLL